jgi:small subunit ribosomal protein S21
MAEGFSCLGPMRCTEGGDGFMATVVLRGGESQDSLLKRFRKKVVKSGVLSTVRRKRWFVSKSEQRRMEKKKAIRRIKRRSFSRDYD